MRPGGSERDGGLEDRVGPVSSRARCAGSVAVPLSNSLGVIVIVFLSLHERLHIDRRDDPRLVAQLTQGPADKMCAEACLHADHTRWQPFKGIHERQPLDLTAKGNLAVGAKTHNVEDFLADVDADRGQG